MSNSAGIIAAGEGSRLKMGGIAVNKPLVPIAGTPLIGHTLLQFVEIGVERVAIIFNESQDDCVDWVRTHFSSLELEILVKSTRSSFESFWRIGRALGPWKALDLRRRFHLFAFRLAYDVCGRDQVGARGAPGA